MANVITNKSQLIAGDLLILRNGQKRLVMTGLPHLPNRTGKFTTGFDGMAIVAYPELNRCYAWENLANDMTRVGGNQDLDVMEVHRAAIQEGLLDLDPDGSIKDTPTRYLAFKREHILVLDGKEVKISQESFDSLKALFA